MKAEASKAADKVADAASGGGGGGISLPKVNLPSGGGGPTLSQLTLPRESFVAETYLSTTASLQPERPQRQHRAPPESGGMLPLAGAFCRLELPVSVHHKCNAQQLVAASFDSYQDLMSQSNSFVPCAVAIGGIAVGALGWRQVDPSFASFFDDAMVKVRTG